MFVTEPIHPDAVKRLSDAGHSVRFARGQGGQISADEVRDADAVITRLWTIGSNVLDYARNLKVIVRHGVGVDNIDVEMATRKGVLVGRVPDANTLSVAEYVVTAVGLLAKRLALYNGAVKRGGYSIRESYFGIDLNGRTLGIIGMGKIGRLVSERVQAAFSMNILAYDPYIRSAAGLPAGTELASGIGELLERSDIVTIHVPLTPQTIGLIGATEMKMMRRGSSLINASRGKIVDEAALAAAIAEGHLSGAVIDVFEEEPPRVDNPLLRLESVIVTPHIAGVTVDSFRRLSLSSVECVIATLAGNPPVSMIVNPVISICP